MLWNRLRNLVRRAAVVTTSDVAWVLSGFEDGEGNLEKTEAEVFSGIGFYARPAAGARAEGIICLVGAESVTPAVVALRDEGTRQEIESAVGGVGPGDTIVWSSGAVAVFRADGRVEIRSKNGVAVPLATKADIDALAFKVDSLRLLFNAHFHSGGTISGNTGIPNATDLVPTPSAVGTLKVTVE